MAAVVENLNGVKDAETRNKYPRIYGDIKRLAGQRNIITHQYGHGNGEINWRHVWETINDRYPSLEAALGEAIKECEEEDSK